MTYFYRKSQNERKRVQFNYELGFCESELVFKGKKCILQSVPILIMILEVIVERPCTHEEIFRCVIETLPKGKEDFYRAYFDLIFTKLQEFKLITFKDNYFSFNNSWVPEELVFIPIYRYKIYKQINIKAQQ